MDKTVKMRKKEIIDKEIEELREKLNEKEEESKVVEFKDNANENPVLQRNGVIVVQSSEHYFYRIMTFLFFIILLSGLIFFGYIFYSGEIDSFIKPIFNNDVSNTFNNNYTINSNIPIDNQVNNEYKNNFTIINNIIVQNSS